MTVAKFSSTSLLRSIFLAAFVATVVVPVTDSAPLCVTLPLAVTREVATNRRRAEHEGVRVVERHIIASTNRNSRKVVRFVRVMSLPLAVANVAGSSDCRCTRIANRSASRHR